MSVKCEVCGKVFTKERGLVVHNRSCKHIEPSKDIEEIKEEAIDIHKAQELGIDVSERTEFQIKKLQDLRASTYDALTRHKIDLQIAELRGH